jgi:hypothetical protein
LTLRRRLSEHAVVSTAAAAIGINKAQGDSSKPASLVRKPSMARQAATVDAGLRVTP